MNDTNLFQDQEKFKLNSSKLIVCVSNLRMGLATGVDGHFQRHMICITIML